MSDQRNEEFETPDRSVIPGMTREHVAEMEASHEDPVWIRAGMAHMIVRTVGRKSGREHKVALPYWLDEHGHAVVVGSYAGAPKHPAWFLNLADRSANPEVFCRFQHDDVWARADVLEGDEYRRIWDALTADRAYYNDYQKLTERRLPLVRFVKLRSVGPGGHPGAAAGGAAVIEHEREGDVHVLRMVNGENKIDPAFLARLDALLDAVEAESTGPCALVLTGEGKFFNNGIDLAAVGQLEEKDVLAFGAEFQRLGVRLARFPVPTVAAINGHAFAGGAVIAMACDFRVMRKDRGWICFSEVDVGVPLPPALMNVVRSKLTPNVARDALLTGHRYTADEAIEAGLVDRRASEKKVLKKALERAAALATKEREVFRKIKQELWSGLGDG